MPNQKEPKQKNKPAAFARTILFADNNRRTKKTKILRQRRFGEMKLGFFSDAGFRNPGAD